MAKAASKSKKPATKSKPSTKSRAKKRNSAGTGKATNSATPPARGKWVYTFGDGKAEGKAELKELLGGKGAESRRDGQSRPAGAARLHHHDRGLHVLLRATTRSYPKELKPQVDGGARSTSASMTGKVFGDRDQSAAGLGALRRARLDARHDGHGAQSRPQRRDRRGAGRAVRRPRFAYDSYRRFITMYSDVVLGVEHHHFEDIPRRRTRTQQGLYARHRSDRRRLAASWSASYKDARRGGDRQADFPQDPHEQLWGAIGAVFSSWMNARAITYRRLHNIPASVGHRRQRAGDGVRQSWARRRPPASRSRAIRRPARSGSMASS